MYYIIAYTDRNIAQTIPLFEKESEVIKSFNKLTSVFDHVFIANGKLDDYLEVKIKISGAIKYYLVILNYHLCT